jgi:hypothetical protein
VFPTNKVVLHVARRRYEVIEVIVAREVVGRDLSKRVYVIETRQEDVGPVGGGRERVFALLVEWAGEGPIARAGGGCRGREELGASDQHEDSEESEKPRKALSADRLSKFLTQMSLPLQS